MIAEPLRPRAIQTGLFLPAFPDPEKLELTIVKLAHLVGHSNIGSPQLVDTHHPGAFSMQRFVPSREEAKTFPRKSKGAPAAVKKGKAKRQKDAKPVIGFRMFRPPLPANVQLEQGRPQRVSFYGARGEVAAASGPWRTSGDWWNEEVWYQDEWDLDVRFQITPTACSGIRRVVHRRALPLLLRFDSAWLVCAGNLRLMYIELHARSAFSFLEGSSLPEELVSACIAHGMPAMALLDRDGVYGAPRFYLAAKKTFDARAHRSRSHLDGRMALSLAGGIQSRVIRIYAA